MKKHWKKVLTLFITLSLLIGGYVIYIFQFKEYDVADTEVTEITKETYTLELPDGMTIELAEDGDLTESQVVSTGLENKDDSSTSNGDTSNSDETTSKDVSGSTSNGDAGGASGKETPQKSTPTESDSTKVTVATIKDKYTPALSSLEVQANSRINALVGRAVQEYQEKKENGESVNYAYFYNKYTAAAAELEGRTDKVFKQVVGIIEKELVTNGYSKSHAQTFVDEYEAAKEARKSALINKAMNN